MAPGARALCLVIIFFTAVLSVEAKYGSNQKRDQSHKYPNSPGHSGAGNHATSARVTYNPFHNSGRTGGGHNTVNQRGQATGIHSNPPSNGRSGSGYNSGQGSGTHAYRPSNGGSGGGSQHPNQQGPAQYPHSGTGTYPHAPSQNLGSAIPINTGHIGNTHSTHVYVRNQQTTNIHTTNIHHYHYHPPPRVYYSSVGGQPVDYPVYTGVLPQYVYVYRASGSRFRQLLAGLALYNLGMLSQNSRAHEYHNRYLPRPHEICRFGMMYNNKYEEVDIDCRLITEYIWSVSSQGVQTGQTMPTEVVNALDPRFNGAPLRVNPGMKCYIRWSYNNAGGTKDVDCGLLQTYVDRSLNSAVKITSTFLLFVTSLVVVFLS